MSSIPNPKTTAPALSPREAADRVWRRFQRRRKPPTDDAQYRCEACGHDTFEVSLIVYTETTTDYEYPCSVDCCTAAARQSDTVTYQVVRTGVLGDDHRVEWMDTETDKIDTEVRPIEVECRSFYDVEDEDPWLWEEVASTDEDAGPPEWTVFCRQCGHETEFAWSHPERGGRIWPVEAGDFNPWKGWPEPRFREDFERRGWLRPEDE